MKCPACEAEVNSGTSGKVVDSRPAKDGQIRRRRICACGHRFTTYERIAEDKEEAEIRRLVEHALPNFRL